MRKTITKHNDYYNNNNNKKERKWKMKMKKKLKPTIKEKEFNYI